MGGGQACCDEAIDDLFNRSKRPAKRECNERGECEPDPKDGLGEKGECAVTVPGSLGLLQQAVAASDGGEQRELGDFPTRTKAQRPQYRTGKCCEHAQGSDEPYGLQVAVCDGGLTTGERRQRVRALMDEENADTSEQDRIDARHVPRVSDERSKWASEQRRVYHA